MTEKNASGKRHLEDLLEHWKNLKWDQKNGYIHEEDFFTIKDGKRNKIPDDCFISQKNRDKRNEFDDEDIFIKLLNKENHHRICKDLFPLPYIGDLKNAKVFILALNPGFLPLDVHAEKNEDFLGVLERNLGQDFNDEYPFFPLNPKYIWHGSGYWFKKLRPILKPLIQEKPMSELEALKKISQSVAVLQYIPYHSVSSPQIKEEMKSSELIREFYESIRGEKLIIPFRSLGKWGIKQKDDTYKINKRNPSITDKESLLSDIAEEILK